MACIWTCGFCRVFAVREEIFPAALINIIGLNLVTALNRFREQCKTLNQNVSKLYSNTKSISYFPDLIGFFSREEIVNWFDQWRRQNSVTPLEHETEWSCYSLPIFSAGCALHHLYPRAFCTLHSFARIKGPRSTSTIAQKNRGLWTV